MEDAMPENAAALGLPPPDIPSQPPAVCESDTVTASVSSAEPGESSTIALESETTIILADSSMDDAENIITVVFEDEQAIGDEATAADDPHTMSEADLVSIRNAIEEKKRLQREQLQQQDTFDEGDSMSRPSSLPSTPASFAENISSFSGGRRARGRRRRMGPPDVNVGKKFTFLRSVTKRVGRRCLRRLLAPGNGDNDRLGEADHCYFTYRSAQDLGTVVDEKTADTSNQSGNKASSDYYRALFFSQYDDPLPQAPTDDPAVTGDVNVDDSDTIREASAATINSTTQPEENEVDQALTKYYDAGLSTFNASYDDAQNLASTIRNIIGQTDEETDAAWEVRVIKAAEAPAQKKLVERVSKLLNDVYYSNLIVTGNADEWMMRVHSIKRATSALRQCFASGIASPGLSLLTWIHWLLMKTLPPDMGAWYLLILRELYCKTPEIVVSIINMDRDVNKRAIDLLSGFLLEPKRLNLSSELFFHQHPLPRLPKDPILMLVSSAIKAHSDMLARGSARCQYFYRNLFPHLGFCMDVKFSPFRKGMSVGLCADQLCAFLRDKIREVQYFHGNRPIVLIGWQTSSVVALKIALEKSLAAVVCLGFPNVTLCGPRGSTGDELLGVACPTLFVVGQFASTCSIEDLTDLKRDMRSERTGLVVVGGADDELKMSDSKLSSENLCQEIVDRCVLESIGEFLCSALEAYVETSDEGPGIGNTTGALSRQEGDAALVVPSKRRRNTIGQNLFSPLLDTRKEGRTRVKSGGKSTSRASIDVSVSDKTANTSTATASNTTSSTKQGDDTVPTAEENQIPGLGATRTRQIRRPHLLDL